MKKPKDNKHHQKSKIDVGSKGYLILIYIFIAVSIYAFAMAFALTSSTEGKNIAAGFLISQLFWPIAAIIMLYKRIRYMKENHIPFRPFNGIKKTASWFRCFLNPWKYKYQPAPPDTTKIGQIISYFRNDYINFYFTNTIEENITQFYQHLLILHKKRLKKLGLTLHSDFKRMVLEKKPAIRFQNIRDGKFRHIQAQEYIEGSQHFMKGSHKIHTIKITGCADYDIIGIPDQGADKKGLSFLCPGCGAVSTAQELLSGCPYCGKKFVIEELSDRVCNMSLYSDPELDFIRAKYRINKFVNRIAFAFTLLETIGFYSMFQDVFIENGASLRELPFAILITVFSLILILGFGVFINNIMAAPFRIIIYNIYKKLKKEKEKEVTVITHNHIFAKTIQKNDPDFSLHSFFSNVRNKLAVIHYADTQNQMTGFTTTNLSQHISQYVNIIHCIFHTLEITDYHIYGNKQVINVTAPLQLLVLNNGKIHEISETVNLILEKNLSHYTARHFGIFAPVCSNCGAPADILSGNVCAYCGTHFNLLDYDWCITSYVIK